MTSAGDDGAPGTPGEAPDRALIPAGDLPIAPVTPDEPVTQVSTFSLDGRAVPALYLIGWIGSLMGAGLLFVAVMSGISPAAPWLFLGGLALLAVGLGAATGSQAIERGRRTDLAYRGPAPVLVFFAIVAITPLVQIVVLAPLSALGLDARSPLATTINLGLQTLLYIGAVRLFVVGPGALTWHEMGVVRPGAGPLRDLVYGAVLAVPVLVVTVVLGGVLSQFLQPAPSPLPDPGGAAGFLLNLVSAAVLAPIGEELFFRGFSTTAWARSVGATPAIVRGAVFFALVHILTLFDATFAEGAQRAAYAFVALLPVGVTLGWLFLTRRSLYAAIGLHAAFNAIQLLLLALAAGTLAR